MKKLHRLHTHSHTGNFHTQCVTFPREESFYCKSTACMYVFTRVLQLFWKGLTGDQRCTSGEQMMFVVSFTDSLKSFQNQAVQLHSLFSFLKNLTSTRCETTVQQCKFICSKWHKINKDCVRNVSLWFNLVNITRWALIYVNYVYVLLCRTLTDLLKQQGGEVSSVENATASSPNGGRANGVSARMLRSRSGECWERPHTHIQTHTYRHTTQHTPLIRSHLFMSCTLLTSLQNMSYHVVHIVDWLSYQEVKGTVAELKARGPPSSWPQFKTVFEPL